METIATITTLSGLSLLAYGLWIFEPWVCFAVIGFILMSAGGAMAKNLQDPNTIANAEMQERSKNFIIKPPSL